MRKDAFINLSNTQNLVIQRFFDLANLDQFASQIVNCTTLHELWKSSHTKTLTCQFRSLNPQSPEMRSTTRAGEREGFTVLGPQQVP